MFNISPREYYRRICGAIKRDFRAFENKPGRKKSWKLLASQLAGLAATAIAEEDPTPQMIAVRTLNEQGENFTLADVSSMSIISILSDNTVELSVRIGKPHCSFDVRIVANVDFYNARLTE